MLMLGVVAVGGGVTPPVEPVGLPSEPHAARATTAKSTRKVLEERIFSKRSQVAAYGLQIAGHKSGEPDRSLRPATCDLRPVVYPKDRSQPGPVEKTLRVASGLPRSL